MDEDNNSSESSGSEFRQKFEAQVAENKALRNLVAETTVKTYKYVRSEDLVDLPADQITSKAQEIETARTDEAEGLVKKFLEDRGVAGDDLDTALSALAQQKAEPDIDSEAAARIASLGSLGGTPSSTNKIDESLTGEERIRAVLNAKGPKTQMPSA